MRFDFSPAKKKGKRIDGDGDGKYDMQKGKHAQ